MSQVHKVLIVDDEAHIRKLITLIVKQVGTFDIIEATNGADAITMYREQKPDLVLMDVNMPIKDGIEALKELNQIDPDVLVVMLTSLANRQTVEEALHGGAVHYIRKDTPKDDIAAGLKEVIRNYLEPEGTDDAPQA